MGKVIRISDRNVLRDRMVMETTRPGDGYSRLSPGAAEALKQFRREVSEKK
jgi:hypothetical protein